MENKFLTTKDVLEKTQISRSTLFLWFKHGKIPDVKRDRNGFRIFTKEDLTRIIRYKNQFQPAPTK